MKLITFAAFTALCVGEFTHLHPVSHLSASDPLSRLMQSPNRQVHFPSHLTTTVPLLQLSFKHVPMLKVPPPPARAPAHHPSRRRALCARVHHPRLSRSISPLHLNPTRATTRMRRPRGRPITMPNRSPPRKPLWQRPRLIMQRHRLTMPRCAKLGTLVWVCRH